LNFYTGLNGAARMNNGVAIGMTDGTAYTLGPNPQFNSWTATEPPALPSLTVTRAFGANIAEQIAEDVIDLQAQYGINQPGGILWFNADALPPGFSFDQVWAIRYGILVRGRQYEPPIGNAPPFTWATPDANAPVWASMDTPPIAFAMRDVMGAADTNQANATNWRGYRYSVYEGVVPLRNMLWGQTP
jgi:type IV pilus assembly protein PilW